MPRIVPIIAVAVVVIALGYFGFTKFFTNMSSTQTNNTQNHIYSTDLEANTTTAQKIEEIKVVTFEKQDGQKSVFQAEFAVTQRQREIGLMHRTQLDGDKGMLFLFGQQKNLTFWMKNTLIPLDMIFINDEGKVVSIVKNAKPCESEPCPLYESIYPAKFVLELNAGTANDHGIKVGDKVNWN